VPSKPTKRKAPLKRRKPATQQDSDCAEVYEPHDGDETSTAKGKPEVKSKDIQGLKYLDMIAPLLERLHNEMCDRDSAGNRDLHYDQYCMLVLLYLFNPTVTALRSIPQASELAKVKKRLGCAKTSLSSLSEASRVFESDRLKAIIAELGQQAAPIGKDARLTQINQTITLVDGSIVSALPSIMQASVFKRTEGSELVQWRLHTHFEVDRYVPTRIDVTPNGGGDYDERAVAEKTIEKDRLYVMDRGYAKFVLFNSIVQSQSSYVCRLRDNTVYEVAQERSLSEAATQADVLSDQVVLLGKTSKNSDKPNHEIRLIQIRCTPHQNRTGGKAKGSTAPNSDGILRIATNLLDVPAEIIALAYSQRWIIEIFFRFFKQFLGCSHLISHSQNGIEIQCYCAIIACLLINLWTGRKPTKRTFEMISYYFMGLASEEELIGHLKKLKAHDEAKSKNQ
jgi:hypothetical protein